MIDTNQIADLNLQPANVRDQIALASFIDGLIKEKKDQSLTPETLARTKEFLLNELNQTINTHLVSILLDEDQKEMETLLDKKVSDEELDNFFENKIPNLVAEITAVLVDFRSVYLYKPEVKNISK